MRVKLGAGPGVPFAWALARAPVTCCVCVLSVLSQPQCRRGGHHRRRHPCRHQCQEQQQQQQQQSSVMSPYMQGGWIKSKQGSVRLVSFVAFSPTTLYSPCTFSDSLSPRELANMANCSLCRRKISCVASVHFERLLTLA